MSNSFLGRLLGLECVVGKKGVSYLARDKAVLLGIAYFMLQNNFTEMRCVSEYTDCIDVSGIQGGLPCARITLCRVANDSLLMLSVCYSIR